jgi:exosortase
LSLTDSQVRKPWLYFGIWIAFSALVFWKSVSALVQLSLHDDTYSYLPLIPLIFAWLLYTERKQSSLPGDFAIWPATFFLLPGVLVAILAMQCNSCSPVNRLSLYTSSLVLVWIGGFVLFLGPGKMKSSFFVLAFLLFAVPIPDFLLNKIIFWLQSGSAAIAEIIFDLSGAPVLREGFIFRLPKISIEVAQECSGIRSSMALLILALILAHLAFRPFWKKLVFIFAGLCMMLIKNGIRIATLTLLANYVNPNFLYGSLHHQGGVVFFLVGLALLIPVFWYLRRGETSPVGATFQPAEE